MTFLPRQSFLFAFALLSIPSLALAQPAGDPDLLPPAEFDVQSRGPVHEAFAQPGDPKLDALAPIPKQPPAPLREAPPDMRPDNDAMQWVPGYWTWDADRQDFTWVSGVYREPPPGRRFVPGHWIQEGTSFRWISGFWTAENQTEVAYVPEPPAPLETGPTAPQPDPNTVYVSGYWVYQNAHYAWRPGYWSPHRVGRIWVAPRYLWTPSGYVFVDGYWDYPLENRGMIFAPVAFVQPVYLQANYVYRPRFVISIGAVTDSLFIAPGAFYFGDYYGAAYVRLGFRPWWEHHHDPIWAYYSWHHRSDPVWAVNHQRLYADRMAGRVALPPRTYAAQLRVGVNVGGVNVAAVVPLKTAASNPGAVANVRIVQNNHAAIEHANIERMREVAAARTITERRAIGAATPGAAPVTMKLPPPAIRAPAAQPTPNVTSAPATPPLRPATNPNAPAAPSAPAHPGTATTSPPFRPLPPQTGGVITPGPRPATTTPVPVPTPTGPAIRPTIVPTPTPQPQPKQPTLSPVPQHGPPSKGPPMPQPKSGPMPTTGPALTPRPMAMGTPPTSRSTPMPNGMTTAHSSPPPVSRLPMPSTPPPSRVAPPQPMPPTRANPASTGHASSAPMPRGPSSGRDNDRTH